MFRVWTTYISGRLLNNLHGRRIFQSSTSYRTFNFTNVRFNLTGSFTGHIKAIFFTISQFYETLAPFLSNGDFEGDKTKTLPWSCSAVIFAGNLSDYDESLLILLFPSICRSVTAWGHIFSDHIFSDNIFSNCLKMDLPEFPPRMFTLGEEPDAIRSISYHSDDTKLFKALCDCLTADEYEDLKASKLGVFIKFKELDFGWTSRLVHFMLSFQLDIKKKFELWSLVVSQPVRCEVTTEMAAFWEKMRVDIDTGPSIEQITEAFYNCDEWSRDDRKRLGYLAIYARYIEGKKFSSATSASLAKLVMDLEKFENYPWGRVAFKVLMDSLKAKDLTQTGYTVDGFIQVLQVWAYYALPELGANYGSPIPNRPSLLLLAYKGGKRQRKFFKTAINKQTIVKNFVQKAFDEMFPKWDGDVDDPAADNIIKVMFNDPGWEWTMEC
ncbi:hypothetical protein IGI04_031188 [Brassica rapa subsp. trilocularis]|uniref:DUF1985 domain-containing protein n=1 Tax=Brassica rapa subsp. trilocularis TaxID=1813537 RepID=A0ABQ7LSV4_BRACM|nr:hypothetical protein IGI04_031188 [Brassica rapa subsp. trilocularis]